MSATSINLAARDAAPKIVDAMNAAGPEALLDELMEALKSPDEKDKETAKQILVKILPVFSRYSAIDKGKKYCVGEYLSQIAESASGVIDTDLLLAVAGHEYIAEELPTIALYESGAITEAVLLKVAEDRDIAECLPYIAAYASHAVTEAVLLKVAKNEKTTCVARCFPGVYRYVSDAVTTAVCAACGTTWIAVQSQAAALSELPKPSTLRLQKLADALELGV